MPSRGESSSAQHHQGDGPTSSLGRVSMGKEQTAVCSGGAAAAAAAAADSKDPGQRREMGGGGGQGGLARHGTINEMGLPHRSDI